MELTKQFKKEAEDLGSMLKDLTPEERERLKNGIAIGQMIFKGAPKGRKRRKMTG